MTTMTTMATMATMTQDVEISNPKIGDLSLQQAQADVEAVMMRLDPTASADDSAFRQVAVSPGARGLARLRNRFGDPLRVLMAIVGLVL